MANRGNVLRSDAGRKVVPAGPLDPSEHQGRSGTQCGRDRSRCAWTRDDGTRIADYEAISLQSAIEGACSELVFALMV